MPLSPPPVLTPEEKALYERITWDGTALVRMPHEEALDMLERMATLAKSLIGRNAVPEVRLAWFEDPDLNFGNSRRSRKEVFEGNGTSGDDILRHPHFLEYLWYFIHGPNLPSQTIAGFCRILEEDRGTSGMVLDQIRKFVRKEMRDNKLPYTAPDEFAKLAIEVTRRDLAETVRSAAKSAK
jgi:hypothetical protein